MNRRRYCPRCSAEIEARTVGGYQRDYCPRCATVFYDNPLPVVSAVVVNRRREVLLVLRRREPQAGKWCLPSGFVELNETVEAAVVRELKEETGLEGEVLRLLDTVSHCDPFYGDLIWVTFEARRRTGRGGLSTELTPGDDARQARYFPLPDLPELAFVPNRRALDRFREHYHDLWAMQDSFQRLEGDGKGDLLSDSLFEILIRDARTITENWVTEVISHPSTRQYARQPRQEVYAKAHQVITRFGQWIIHSEWIIHPESIIHSGERKDSVWDYFRRIGAARRTEGYQLAELISALSLTRKHIFAHVFAQGGVWEKPLEMYRAMEFVSRVNLFFDKATYHIARGFEKAARKEPVL